MTDRNYFMLKRLHSLCGVVPIAGFVMFHLFENSESVMGADRFNDTVHSIRSMPYLYVLEVGLLGPILFHALLGIYLSTKSRPNTSQFMTRANVSYTLQRLTGLILLFFISFHVYTTRFANIPSDHMFQYMNGMFMNPVIATFYVLGIASAAFHLANGLFGFAYSWGIVTGEKSMEMAWKACMVLGLVVFLMGFNAMAGFFGKGTKFLFHQDAPSRAAEEMAATSGQAPQAVSVTAKP
jgi:succinate dehydrogenase / fumarate reductase cytochrome b subunit